MTIKEEWTRLPTYGVPHHLQTNNIHPTYYSASFSALPLDQYCQDYHDSPYMDNRSLMYETRCPRSDSSLFFNNMEYTGLPMDNNMCAAYPPATYHIDPQAHFDITAISDRSVNEHLVEKYDDYSSMYTPQSQPDERNGYLSPYSDMSRPSPPPDEMPHGIKISIHGRDGVFDKDLPYAQLIYKALKEADGHTMILRDIYDWFKKNTEKATTSQSKGWQNSIRHNLSMNGVSADFLLRRASNSQAQAFEKVDQPGEDPRKGYMWRLTKQALRDGVKSTTRYRKQPKLAYRTRHTSAARSSRRAANNKRSKILEEQYRSEPYLSTTIPDAFDTLSDSDMSYASPPYYSPPLGSGYPVNPEHDDDDYSAANSLELFPIARPDIDMLPISEMSIADSAYMMGHHAGEPLFSNSPTPPADEPRTPPEPDVKYEMEDMQMAHPCFYDAY